jgi:hypothetical protein
MKNLNVLVETQGLNSLFEEVFDLMTAGTITPTKCKAVMCNITDEDKDEPETELEVFIDSWLSKVDKHCCRAEGAKA